MKRGKIIIIALSLYATTQAQLMEVAIGHGEVKALPKINNPAARIQATQPLTIPFWDDFSFTQEKNFPNDTLWISRKTVWVNNGAAIKPPSVFVATFDGIDSTGKPHNSTDMMAKGFADKLVSMPIRMDLIPGSQTDSVYLSFFYQMKGEIESPDRNDSFSLWFKDINGTWEKVFEVSNVGLDHTVFYYKNLKVDPKFFHNTFQFKFQNFGRLSGPYDAWNLDYIYLNKRRTAGDVFFHDQTLTKPLTSIFNKYTSIPIKHYKDTATTVTILPKIGLYSLYSLPTQPFKYTSSAKVASKKNGITSTKDFFIEPAGDPNFLLPNFTHWEQVLNKTIPIDSLDLSADSIHIDFKLGFASGDTNTVKETPFFYPINFTHNDTIHSEFILAKHYAYDDGSAEYGAGLNKPGSEMAYGFDMFTKASDTVVAVDIYFPEFGDNLNRTVILKLWNSVGGKPSLELHRQTIPVQRTLNNLFTHYPLTEPVGVKGRFFIGWAHTVDMIIPVGLDKNTESSGEIYANITGTWEQNQTVSGSLMIRPIYGKGRASTITSMTDEHALRLFPNPTQGEFFIPSTAENISITNMLGVNLGFTDDDAQPFHRIKLTDPVTGIILVRWHENKKTFSVKVLVHN